VFLGLDVGTSSIEALRLDGGARLLADAAVPPSAPWRAGARCPALSSLEPTS
jgi:hypothetical protein